MEKLDFNRGWTYQKAGAPAQTVDLPHDAMIHEQRDPACKNGRTTGFYPGAKYIYKKVFRPRESWAGKALMIEFEGVYQNAQVALNGETLCARPYGYTNFFVELTGKLRFGTENELVVTADNSGEPCTRWYSGGGIYRPVWLHIGSQAHIRPDGVRIQTRSYAPAVLNVRTDAAASGDIAVAIWDGGREVARAAGADVDIAIPDAQLWSADAPNLYTCRVELSQGGVVQDRVELPCGVCKLEWSPEGLLINGVGTKLRGACIHHDNGVLGACEFPEAALRRIRILKEAGFNAVRSAHNPISRAMLDACAQLGMYVMDEFADMWYEHKNRYDYASYFEQWHQRDLTAMVEKDYSHPCVILYSIGNEVTETAEEWGIQLAREMAGLCRSLDRSRPVTCGINMALNTMHFAGLGVYQPGPDEPPRRAQKKNPRALELLAQMGRTRESQAAARAAGGGSEAAGTAAVGMRQEMGTRQNGKLVGSEFFNEAMKTMKERQRAVVTQPIAKVLSEDAYAALDIAGYNYADGRYERDGEEYPDRVSVGTETLPQRIYQNWRRVEKLPYLIGDFMWTGWDYLGEAGIGAFCYDSVGTKDKDYPALLAGSGVIDILGHPRPEVWLNKAVFGVDKGPYIGVEPVTHSHENRLISAWRFSDAVHSWSWAGCEGRKAELIIYADAASVEVRLNGVSIGRKRVEGCRAKFETVYQPGVLEAAAYGENGSEIGRDRLATAGAETVLTVRASKESLTADGQGLCYLDISLADGAGTVKTSEDRPVTVAVEGAGVLAGLGSAAPFNEEPYTDSTHRTYYGRIQAVIRSGYAPGTVRVAISAPGCRTKILELSVR